MTKKYRKIQPIEAVQWNGDNELELEQFGCNFHRDTLYLASWYIRTSRGVNEE